MDLEDPESCGVRQTGKIVGGMETQINEYPWMALLRRIFSEDGRFFCGGSLISENWVLTAAHCLRGTLKPDSVEVRLGEHSRTSNNETSLTINIMAAVIIIHPDHYKSLDVDVNDIALVKLSESVDLNIYMPVCLPQLSEEFTGELSTVIGWGSIIE